jgi:dTDP-4-dehydrorhamnose reductase
MKVVILGSKGNLGSRLMKTFGEYDPVGWDRENVDIGDKEDLFKKLSNHKPDVVINAVAYNAVDKCEEDEGFALAKRLNADAPGFLADYCLDSGSILIHYVSDYVFNGDKAEGYKEDDPTAPISKYGLSKQMGETEVLKRAEHGLKYYLIRTSKLFGPKGESEAAKESFFDLMLRLSREKEELKVIDKSEISCFTYTVDLANETKKLILKNHPFGVYHIFNTEPASWYEGVLYLFELKNIKNVKLIPIAAEDFPRPAKRPRYSVLINTKLEPLRSWKDALKEYLN